MPDVAERTLISTRTRLLRWPLAVDKKINQKMERSKRELFRKMTTQIVGQHLADLFRKPVQLASLPKMGSLKPRPKPDAINLADAGLADLFIQE